MCACGEKPLMLEHFVASGGVVVVVFVVLFFFLDIVGCFGKVFCCHCCHGRFNLGAVVLTTAIVSVLVVA